MKPFTMPYPLIHMPHRCQPTRFKWIVWAVIVGVASPAAAWLVATAIFNLQNLIK